MNLSEEFSKLDSVDLAESQRLVQKWKRKLNESREPDLLWELIDHQLSTQSQPALRVLAAVKDLHSQDFFAKVNDCLYRQSTRLPALKLLAHMLSGQTSWLYKIVHSPVFPTLLQLLKPNTNIVVITSTVYVLCAIIPIAPFHITPHLPDIFESFTQLATLSTQDHNRSVPRELFLGVDTAIYFLFLQIYALYPCSFVQYLKGRFGPMGEIQVYHEHIAPLFNYVQLHPNLITELPSQETHKTKWRLQDPNEIATLALSLCTDPSLVPMDTASPVDKLIGTQQPQDTLPDLPKLTMPCDPKFCGPLNSHQLSDIWSPSLALGQIAPPIDTRQSSLQTSPTSEPVSLDNSVHATPILPGYAARQSYFNYSPTASLETDTVSMLSALAGERQDTPSSSSQGHSGRSSPIKSSPANASAGGTPRSLREKLSHVFKWKSSEAEAKEEDFTNISLSEFDYKKSSANGRQSVQPRHSVSTNFDGAEKSSLFTCDSFPGSENSSPRSKRSSPGDGPSPDRKNPYQPHPTGLPSSYPVVNRNTLLLASEKLQKIAARDTENMTQSLPTNAKDTFFPFITIPSVDSIATTDTLTPPPPIESDSPLLLTKSITKKPKTNHTSSPSPTVALDVYIQTGRVLHSGSLSNLSLPDLEGIDWDHYGSCPHSEELVTMNNLSVMLHSQLLYERQQCQLHAKRNRRLMTEVRNVAKLENEIVSLHQHLHQHQQIIACLKEEIEKRNSKSSTSSTPDILAERRLLQKENESLNEEVKRLQKELHNMKSTNSSLSKELNQSQDKVSSLELERDQMMSKLSEVDKLKSEIQSLTKEHLLLEELYHQQKLALTALRTENTEIKQLKDLNETLIKEKEAATGSLKLWRRDLDRLQSNLKEKELEISQKNDQIDVLKSSLHNVQEKSKDKIDSLDNKYQALKNINQQLEVTLLAYRNVDSNKYSKRVTGNSLTVSPLPY